MGERGTRLRLLGMALTALALTAAGAGCGEDEDEDNGGGAAQPKTLTIKLTGSGKNLRFSMPKSVPGGVVRIQFTNAAKGEHGVQLIRVDAGHTPQEGLEAAGNWAENGRSLPAWVHIAGGVGFAKTGATRSVTQELAPGKYAALDVESDTTASFDVRPADSAAKLPTSPVRIDATEYEFNAIGLKSGKNSVLFDNKGSEPHVIAGALLKPGKTIADARRYAKNEKGEDPTDESAAFDTATVDGGVKQVVELDFKRPGNYVLLCYVPDRKGGPPHIAKGMISQGVVR